MVAAGRNAPFSENEVRKVLDYEEEPELVDMPGEGDPANDPAVDPAADPAPTPAPPPPEPRRTTAANDDETEGPIRRFVQWLRKAA
jgi:hypothetical protein